MKPHNNKFYAEKSWEEPQNPASSISKQASLRSISSIGTDSSLTSIAKDPKPQAHFNSNDNGPRREEPDAKKPQLFGKKVHDCILPYKIFCRIFLRFPIQTSGDGFVSKISAASTISFLITSIIISISGVLFLINFIGSVLDFPKIQSRFKTSSLRSVNTSMGGAHAVNKSSKLTGDYRFEEEYLLRRHIIPVIILTTCLCHTIIASWQFFKVRKFAAEYLTFWIEAAQEMSIDVAEGVKKYMTTLITSFGVFSLFFLGLVLMNFAPVAFGGPAVFAILQFRCFYPSIHTHSKFYIARGVAGVMFFYLLIVSKLFIMFFALVCKLLSNGFAVWNRRLEQALLPGRIREGMVAKDMEDFDEPEPTEEGRTSFEELFQDYVLLLDLLDGADKIFANGMESYYVTQGISMIFEMYYLFRSQAETEVEFQGARRLDGVIVLLYFVQSLSVLVAVSLAGADVGEKANYGLEIIRSRGMMGKMTEEETYFMMTMYSGFTGFADTSLCGAGYFNIDKGFLVFIGGTIFSYFIILIQFSPALIVTKEANSAVETYDLEKLLEKVEGTYQYTSKLQVGYMHYSELATQLLEFNNTYSITEIII